MIRIVRVALVLALASGTAQALTTDALLDTLQHTAFDYFWQQANATNGLIKDRSTVDSPSSIAAVGFGLSAICIGIDHGWVSRADGGNRVLTTLQTLWTKPQGSAAAGTIGYKGLYYHFLNMSTAERTWNCELSTIDTALLFAGVIDAKQYFGTGDPMDVSIRALADSIYYRANWEFVRNFSVGIYMGWKPGSNFSGFGLWTGYNEAMILYILALGSPTYPVPEFCWQTWDNPYDDAMQTLYGQTYVPFPPLFGHQYSHCWVDFRYIKDGTMQNFGITYWENSRRATLAQRAYCIANPAGRIGYGPDTWGLTASDDPYVGYLAHGAPPPQNDNGTLSPTALGGSVAFAPGVVIPALHNLYDNWPQLWGAYGFKDAFNPGLNWVGPDYLGIDQGPFIIMIENFRTGAVWNRFMQNADVQRGLTRAGFVPATDVATGPRPELGDAILFQSTPNPARGSTLIPFHLGAAGRVSLVLFDAAGRQVRRLANGTRAAGDHVVPLDTQRLPNGVYYYRLEYEGKQTTKQCIVVK